MNYSNVLDNIEEHVTTLFKKSHLSSLVYHDITHTRSVVAAAKQIAGYYQLNDQEDCRLMVNYLNVIDV